MTAEPFVLDRFQREALAAIDVGRNVLVAAPTGAGKTVVAEHAVAKALAEGRRAFYTTPIKALSNQKYADLVRRHGRDQVGLLTGDNAVNPGAGVVVMTTEVLRNMVYASSPALDGLAWVVLDEVHFLQDTYRGPVWEEVIVHTPPSVRFVCLSATVSNADELAGWITAARGPTETVVEHERPVDLVNHFLVYDKGADDLVQVETLVDGRPNPEGSRFDAPVTDGPKHERFRARGRHRWGTPRRVEVVDHLSGSSLLPAIYFVFSRKGCDDAAKSVLDAGLRLTKGPERARIRAIVETHVDHLSDGDLAVLGFDRFLAGLEAGVAAHHAGMVPPFKEAVEACFVEGLVKVVFATETLALGINMPARSVVIESLSKFTGEHHEDLTPSQYTQLTGRAGRRGLDPVGHALVLWSPWYGFDKVAALASSREFVLRSAFQPTYNMVVNLVRRYDREQAHELLGRSFAQYQADASLGRIVNRRATRQQLLAEATARATCELGDIDEYRSLRADERRRKREARQGARVQVAERIGELRPGRCRAGGRPPARRALGVAPKGRAAPPGDRQRRPRLGARRRRLRPAAGSGGGDLPAQALRPAQPDLPAAGGERAPQGTSVEPDLGGSGPPRRPAGWTRRTAPASRRPARGVVPGSRRAPHRGGRAGPPHAPARRAGPAGRGPDHVAHAALRCHRHHPH
ncbi:DEAD/DEAH box helicase [Aquihabitans daechungensis]|uniref:DEAD/DEAH box helicase n=1 Tax=Aquihabitans daechungensis TaxID=1052257 RepID=UPI003B9EE0B4